MKTELKILMLEDNVSDAELVQHELRRGGLRFRARCVQTRKAFVEALKLTPPDVILSDHGLPSFSGFEALAVAKKECPVIPFIFVTGATGTDEEIELSFKRGASGHVPKDRLSQLAPVVRQAIREAGEAAAHSELKSAAPAGEDMLPGFADGVRNCAICLLDKGGRVTACDTGTTWMEGCGSEELIGQHFSKFYPMEGLAQSQPALALTWAVTAGRFEEETLLLRKDQFPYWAHVIITALLDQRERLRGFAFVARDITQLKLAEAD